jgi:hypothetical protein
LRAGTQSARSEGGNVGIEGFRRYEPGEVTEALVRMALALPDPR